MRRRDLPNTRGHYENNRCGLSGLRGSLPRNQYARQNRGVAELPDRDVLERPLRGMLLHIDGVNTAGFR